MVTVVLRYLLMSTLVLLVRSETVNFPGVVEQIRTNRHSRVSRDFVDQNEYIPVKTITSAPTRAPAEDAVEHLKEFIHVNPETLTAQQRRLLEQIVDRVARYGGLMVTNKIPVESNGDEDAQARAHPTRSGIRNKTKSTTTKRPSSVMVTKTVQKQSTSSASPAQSASTASLNQSATTAKATQKPLTRQKVKQPPTTDSGDFSQFTTLTPSVPPTNHEVKTTSATSRHTVKPSELSFYDYNVTASALIESLSKPNSVAYQQRIRLPAPSVSTHHHQTPPTNATKNKLQQKPPATGTSKPTKYHYYPHNQHIYLLPECAIQQVCNAVYVRLNYTQPLCACPSRYRDPCSASLNEDDLHTTKLIGDRSKKAITLAKTCESTTEMRECRAPKDWSLLALQNVRTGKSHYLVICRCPDGFRLDGPMSHDQPTYASVPGIRVFGMMCVKPGYFVKHPTQSQPPKRRPTRPPSHKYTDSYHEAQYQANYQYLNRPGSPLPFTSTISSRPQYQNIVNTYSRRTRNGTSTEELEMEDTSEQDEEEDLEDTTRSERSYKSSTPEFPIHRIKELIEQLQWDQ
ncbi:uncharacterized protein LOC129797284 [Lutzomyia longipalpis]|nr:uncharacterized protein LOC129797284 [Lutzomyia longipalpis]